VSSNPIAAVMARNRRAAGAGIPAPIASVPDNELINTLVAHGQPRYGAEELRTNPQLRLLATRFWVDVGDAGRGDKAAKERVDYCRASWEAMRRADLGSHIIDPKDLL
jgi:hypothetical protein